MNLNLWHQPLAYAPANCANSKILYKSWPMLLTAVLLPIVLLTNFWPILLVTLLYGLIIVLRHKSIVMTQEGDLVNNSFQPQPQLWFHTWSLQENKMQSKSNIISRVAVWMRLSPVVNRLKSVTNLKGTCLFTVAARRHRRCVILSMSCLDALLQTILYPHNRLIKTHKHQSNNSTQKVSSAV